MTTESKLNANRANAQHSTGPRTAEGRIISSQNALRFGLFSTKNCVQPHEAEEYETLSTALWNDLAPKTTTEELFATEVIRATWRLRRCAEVESTLGDRSLEADPMLDADLLRIQTAVDRARTQCHGIIRRSLAEIRRLKAEQAAKPETTASAKRTQPEPENPASIPPKNPEIGRNTPCPCKSGQKYKRCCGINAPAILYQAA